MRRKTMGNEVGRTTLEGESGCRRCQCRLGQVVKNDWGWNVASWNCTREDGCTAISAFFELMPVIRLSSSLSIKCQNIGSCLGSHPQPCQWTFPSTTWCILLLVTLTKEKSSSVMEVTKLRCSKSETNIWRFYACNACRSCPPQIEIAVTQGASPRSNRTRKLPRPDWGYIDIDKSSWDRTTIEILQVVQP